MSHYYSAERNVQILLALMKAHGVRKVVVSPGATNVCVVGSLQSDPYFQLYSSVDERSAAYIACGLAAESGEPVALSCTGATASRNYAPGLTEAFYRKLPVLAITSSRPQSSVGMLVPQATDRTQQFKDMLNLSVQVPTVADKNDEWAVSIQINKALLALRHRGGGPVHINIVSGYSRDFSVRKLPEVTVIRRYCPGDAFPEIPARGKIAIFVGAHTRWSEALTQAVDDFCATYDAVVICDQTSNYRGKYRVLAKLSTIQQNNRTPNADIDLLIHIGEVSGSYMTLFPKAVWRVSPDGEIRDRFRKLTAVFDMEEQAFFRVYAAKAPASERNSFLRSWQADREELLAKLPELPFSNLWIAQHTAPRLPADSVLYLAILNTLRAWCYFETPDSIICYANTGGFGIDGGTSSLLGTSLANPNRLCFGITGDLGFFYDLNALGNRHVGRNLRLILINNGLGTEFKNFNHYAALFGDEADQYIAAAGHYGRKSRKLVRHYAEDLGFEYMSAEGKDDYLAAMDRFFTPELTDRPMLLEVFTDSKLESDALHTVMTLNGEEEKKGGAKVMVKRVLGENNVRTLKRMIRK